MDSQLRKGPGNTIRLIRMGSTWLSPLFDPVRACEEEAGEHEDNNDGKMRGRSGPLIEPWNRRPRATKPGDVGDPAKGTAGCGGRPG